MEPFILSVPQANAANLDIPINPGEMLFVLGANGTGKSTLMHRFYTAYKETARRMSAHRQTWFPSGANTLSAQGRLDTGTNIRGADVQERARWTDDYAPQRPAVAVYDLVDAENVRARSIAAAVDERNLDLAKTLSQKDAPIKTINKLLRLSNIPIEIAVQSNGAVVASKSGSKPYNIDRLSDGERNALLVAAEVLTVPKSTLILIDEPERHLHLDVHAVRLDAENTSRSNPRKHRCLLTRLARLRARGPAGWPCCRCGTAPRPPRCRGPRRRA